MQLNDIMCEGSTEHATVTPAMLSLLRAMNSDEIFFFKKSVPEKKIMFIKNDVIYLIG